MLSPRLAAPRAGIGVSEALRDTHPGPVTRPCKPAPRAPDHATPAPHLLPAGNGGKHGTQRRHGVTQRALPADPLQALAPLLGAPGSSRHGKGLQGDALQVKHCCSLCFFQTSTRVKNTLDWVDWGGADLFSDESRHDSARSRRRGFAGKSLNGSTGQGSQRRSALATAVRLVHRSPEQFVWHQLSTHCSVPEHASSRHDRHGQPGREPSKWHGQPPYVWNEKVTAVPALQP